MKSFKKLFMAALACASLLCACEGVEADSAKRYGFISGETEIFPGDKADVILAALGEPNEYDESPSCAFEGLDKVYSYGGFEIQTFSKDGGEYIYSVALTNDLVKTPEGISVGAFRDDVVAKYGEEYTAVGESLRYEADNCILQFILREGRVASIKYIAKEN